MQHAPVSVVNLSAGALNWLTAGLAVLAVLYLWGTRRFPQTLIKSYKKSPLKSLYRMSAGFTSFQFVRSSLCCVVAVFGFILALCGAEWQVTVPFFTVSIAAQLLAFPTRRKWLRLEEKINQVLEQENLT
jgi:hypothetical protein